MAERPKRETVDLSRYPDLIVIYLGMRVNALAGIKTLLGFGPKIAKSVEAQPKGLLLHETMLYSLRHFGMRQYWSDLEALEAWTRSDPHREWWKNFLRDSGGTGFWHEAYFRRGGMEGVYVDMDTRAGFAGFAPVVPARGSLFSARRRLGLQGEAATPGAITEEEFYSG
ncbi:MAG: phenylacetaldoxime dehydratase family protein [Acidobacteriia bacterium]|nr:phenylacetaldoxime dehydratase family protein [Terriglobia bacterium]